MPRPSRLATAACPRAGQWRPSKATRRLSVLPYYTFPDLLPNLLPVLLPYQQATDRQRAEALAYLRQRLRGHFPSLVPRAWARTLHEFQPVLLLTGPLVTLPYADLTQLAQHLADSPELPLLDPPLYGPAARQLAQYFLHSSELAAGVLPELLASAAPCGPRLYALLSRLVRPDPLAEQIVQAWRWELPGGPLLPPGVPDGGPAPGSLAATQLLRQLGRAGGHLPP